MATWLRTMERINLIGLLTQAITGRLRALLRWWVLRCICVVVCMCVMYVCARARARWRARVRIGLPCSVFLRVDMHARSNAHRSCIWKGNWSCTRETESLFGSMAPQALRTRRLRIRRSRLGHAVIRVQPRSLAL